MGGDGSAQLCSRACLGEWQGRGKSIKIRQSGAELLVDMGPGVPALVLVATSAEHAWPAVWAVVRRNDPGKALGPQSTVYIFELPTPTSPNLLVRKPTGDGVVEFERVGPPPELAEDRPPKRDPGSPAHGRSPRGRMSFADNLAKIVSERKVIHTDHERLAADWSAFESKLLDSAIELFKQRCLREAEMQKCTASVSFEVLSREIEDFPKKSLSVSTYYVKEWGPGITAESWFYATRGPAAVYTPEAGDKVLFAEVLQSMLPKFVDRVRQLGFTTCSHELGTWKIIVSWPEPEDE